MTDPRDDTEICRVRDAMLVQFDRAIAECSLPVDAFGGAIHIGQINTKFNALADLCKELRTELRQAKAEHEQELKEWDELG